MKYDKAANQILASYNIRLGFGLATIFLVIACTILTFLVWWVCGWGCWWMAGWVCGVDILRIKLPCKRDLVKKNHKYPLQILHRVIFILILNIDTGNSILGDIVAWLQWESDEIFCRVCYSAKCPLQLHLSNCLLIPTHKTYWFILFIKVLVNTQFSIRLIQIFPQKTIWRH